MIRLARGHDRQLAQLARPPDFECVSCHDKLTLEETEGHRHIGAYPVFNALSDKNGDDNAVKLKTA